MRIEEYWGPEWFGENAGLRAKGWENDLALNFQVVRPLFLLPLPTATHHAWYEKCTHRRLQTEQPYMFSIFKLSLALSMVRNMS